MLKHTENPPKHCKKYAAQQRWKNFNRIFRENYELRFFKTPNGWRLIIYPLYSDFQRDFIVYEENLQILALWRYDLSKMVPQKIKIFKRQWARTNFITFEMDARKYLSGKTDLPQWPILLLILIPAFIVLWESQITIQHIKKLKLKAKWQCQLILHLAYF